MTTIRAMHPTYSDEKIKFMEEYKHEGKTIEEWENELEHCNGLNENGKPLWYDLMAKITDATAFAEISYDYRTQSYGC